MVQWNKLDSRWEFIVQYNTEKGMAFYITQDVYEDEGKLMKIFDEKLKHVIEGARKYL